MKAPDFWHRTPPSLLASLLAPFGRGYMRVTARRMAREPEWRAPVPVVCIGNLAAGGAGKTPVVIDLATRLRSAGLDVHVLTRGYGGRERGPVRVAADFHEAADVGDEALLLARVAPTWVSADRVDGARAAVAAGAGALLMDDGFQNPALAKDLSLVVVDGARAFGNGLGIPAGPLRESVAEGLARADAVVVMGADRRGVLKRAEKAERPVLRARLQPADAARDLAGERVFAFAGIGDPEKFLATLDLLGAEVVGRRDFADHHRYTDKEAASLLAEAQALNALPVTTEKDAVRLPAAARAIVRTVPVRVVWDDKVALTDLVLAPFAGRF